MSSKKQPSLIDTIALLDWPGLRSWLRNVVGILLALLLSGSLLGDLGKANESVATTELTGVMDDGLSGTARLGILSGFRAPLAAITFIEAYLAWEDKDLERTTARLQLAAAMDPSKPELWTRAAYMIALDMPHWRWRQWRRQHGHLDAATQQRIRDEQLAVAFAMLERGEATLPHTYALPLARARILIATQAEPRRRLEALRQAVNKPDVPYAVQRLYASMLVDHGHQDEALSYLKTLYTTLPEASEDALAMKPLVALWIEQLENDNASASSSPQ